jgi:cation:H+ antiporter
MTTSILQFLGCAAVIVLAGGALTQFGDIISNKTKLGGLLVGSILIAGATSLPELAIDISALRVESPDLAVGDLFGSSLFNLLILAVLDLTRYSHGQMLSKKAAGHGLAATTSIALTAIAALFIILGPQLENVTLFRLGPGSFVMLAAYAIGIRIVYFGRKATGADKQSPTAEEDATLPLIGKIGLKGAIVGYLVSAAAILAAAPFLAHAAKDLAEQTGLGGTFFGTIFVALCTSLPEVVTTFSAVRMKAFDMAIGNIFGSNCFNMLLFVPLDLVVPTPLFSLVSTTHAYTALCGIVVTSVVILGQLFQTERKKHFLEPDAWLAIFLIVASFTGLYFVRE